MKVILTHEQADFDALASMLGAHLLDETRVPVLPRRMNRNVQAFLTLYGLTMPFVEPDDLPRKAVIESITLVDTQSMVTLKGLSDQTRVQVIDHHGLRSNLPEEWQVEVDEVGATSTLLVEALEASHTPLTNIQASLLLLGIYEDTGKLTYSRTTNRDVRAAAWLLEQGASLEIVQTFINHPLSHAQQELYDRLRRQAETHQIHGNTILIGMTDATHTDEELSTIAHKLRDLLDPDAIFLLVDTTSGVQLVARATTDLVDVGAVARRFGGGGHPRAAAALIRESSAKQECQKLFQILPEIVRPAVTVAEIMSRRPQVLSPEMPVAKAAEQMRRYGYEGYPVVEEGRLVGLLTRRAVDRTLNHKLNLSVRAVMEAGSVTVGPDTPLEQLQQIMTDSGWGQVPVVVGEEIIGIVTRTDLLKVLAPKQAASGRQNLAEKLEASLPAARLALLWAAAKTAREQQAAFYVVGGFVRDLLLERPSLDYDLVVEGDAIQLGEALAARYGGRTTTHKRFGTAKWWIDEIREQLAAQLAEEFDLNLLAEDLPETLDLVSARREFYTHPTALPTVERGSIKLDLHRRDFTINTLAMRLDGNYYGDLHDHWGGLADLQAGTVRVLHSLSFVDDPTRILRAVRFEQRFDFRIGPRTLELLKNALSLLDRVSGDRLRHELDNMLFEENRDKMLARLEELGVLAAIHPALKWDEAARERVTAALAISPPESWLKTDRPLQPAAAYLSWLLPSAAEDASEAAERIRLPGWLGDILAQAIQVWEQQSGIGEMKPSQVVEVMAEQPELGLLVCRELSEDAAFKEKVSAYFEKWRQVQPVTDGHELRARGIEPGPRYREVLDQLRAAWLDGEISSEAEEKAMLEKLLDG